MAVPEFSTSDKADLTQLHQDSMREAAIAIAETEGPYPSPTSILLLLRLAEEMALASDEETSCTPTELMGVSLEDAIAKAGTSKQIAMSIDGVQVKEEREQLERFQQVLAERGVTLNFRVNNVMNYALKILREEAEGREVPVLLFRAYFAKILLRLGLDPETEGSLIHEVNRFGVTKLPTQESFGERALADPLTAADLEHMANDPAIVLQGHQYARNRLLHKLPPDQFAKHRSISQSHLEVFRPFLESEVVRSQLQPQTLVNHPAAFEVLMELIINAFESNVWRGGFCYGKLGLGSINYPPRRMGKNLLTATEVLVTAIANSSDRTPDSVIRGFFERTTAEPGLTEPALIF